MGQIHLMAHLHYCNGLLTERLPSKFLPLPSHSYQRYFENQNRFYLHLFKNPLISYQVSNPMLLHSLYFKLSLISPTIWRRYASSWTKSIFLIVPGTSEHLITSGIPLLLWTPGKSTHHLSPNSNATSLLDTVLHLPGKFIVLPCLLPVGLYTFL